jgi:putative PIN family toxin of toxin-antitoxin system
MKVLLDTNVLISAVVYGGKPREILKTVLLGETIGITSEILICELIEVLRLKFAIEEGTLGLIERLMHENFVVVNPVKMIKILRDEADNRVLETALEGKCDYIITGDKELLCLGEFEKIRIVTISDFFPNL